MALLEVAAIALDAIVLGVFATIKFQTDPLIVLISSVSIAAAFGFERVHLSRWIGRGEHIGHGTR